MSITLYDGHKYFGTTKTIQYYGKRYIVPEKTIYMAIDKDGLIGSHFSLPTDRAVMWTNSEGWVYVAKCNRTFNWRKSLRRV